jgi:hypothetical protein
VRGGNMLKIKDDVDLKELEKFGFTKIGGLEKEWHFYYYQKYIFGIFNSYQVIINGYTREIKIFKNLSLDLSFANKELVKRNRKIKDLITAGLVEKVEERK